MAASSFPKFALMSRQTLPPKVGSVMLGSPPVVVSKTLCSASNNRFGLFESIIMEPLPGKDPQSVIMTPCAAPQGCAGLEFIAAKPVIASVHVFPPSSLCTNRASPLEDATGAVVLGPP